MYKAIQLLISVLLLTAKFTYGQATTTNADEEPYIEVTGTAETQVIPDEIYIAIIIREQYVNKVKVTIDEQETRLKAAVKALGIDLKNLSLSDANADYVKIRWQKKDVLTKKDYTLKVSTATAVGEVFRELEKLEITDAFVSKVSYSAIDSLKKEVKIKAIKAAKEKADYLLTAIGEQTGKPLVVKEHDNSMFHPSVNVSMPGVLALRKENAMNGDKMEADTDNDIQFQKIKIQTSIYVKFLIK